MLSLRVSLFVRSRLSSVVICSMRFSSSVVYADGFVSSSLVMEYCWFEVGEVGECSLLLISSLSSLSSLSLRCIMFAWGEKNGSLIGSMIDGVVG